MIQLIPIGHVRNSRKDVEDDNWGGILSEIVIEIGEEALQGLEDFSHAEVIFYFDRVDEAKIVSGARHPRNNPNWPKVGILAQRGKNRPNRLGLATVFVIRREGSVLFVKGLDAVDGTPVLDIKPVMKEFLSREEIRQPAWVSELMKKYWNEKGNE
jgi:tRNA-Thr(GGU) m(6)t(6)A37 methyltransferase TsaA